MKRKREAVREGKSPPRRPKRPQGRAKRRPRPPKRPHDGPKTLQEGPPDIDKGSGKAQGRLRDRDTGSLLGAEASLAEDKRRYNYLLGVVKSRKVEAMI